MTGTVSREVLVEALDAAAKAHHDYETVTLKGVRDAQWSGFYAAYVLGRVSDVLATSALARVLEAVEADDGWSGAAADDILRAIG